MADSSTQTGPLPPLPVPHQRVPRRPLPATVAAVVAIGYLTGCGGPLPMARYAPVQSPPSSLALVLDSAIARVMAERGIPGAAVAFLRGDTIVHLRGYGVTDRTRGTPVTPETVFQIASATKPFTAMAVLLLVEGGRLALDDPASRYLDWLPERYRSVTIRQLLQHTGGVAPDMRRANVDEMSEAEFRTRFLERPASFPAGARWEYANAGYTLLSQIVEVVSGVPFGRFLADRIFLPLRMARTGYRAPRRADPHQATGYDLADGQLQQAPHVFSGWGNSGIESTAADLARWAAAVHRGAMLRPQSYHAMFAPGRVTGDTAINFRFRDGRAAYGLGWFVMQAQGEPLHSHGGAIAGFSSIINRFPQRGWTIIVLSNAKQGADRQGQAEVIAHAVLDVARRANGHAQR